MSKLFITKPGIAVSELSTQIANGSAGLKDNVSVSSATDTAVASVESSKDIIARKAMEAKVEQEKRSERLEGLFKDVDDLDAIYKSTSETNALVSEYANTSIGAVTDVTQVDLSTVVVPTADDFTKAKLPNPQDYGQSLSDVVDLSSVDLSGQPLGNVNFSMLSEPDMELSDVISSTTEKLKTTDLRRLKNVVLDYSDSAYDGVEFPSASSRNGSPITDLVDLSSVDLSSVIDLSGITAPTALNSTPPTAFDNRAKLLTNTITDTITAMGKDGDLLSLSSSYNKLNGVNLLGKAISPNVINSSVHSALRNFSVPGFSKGDKLPSVFADRITHALTTLPNDWMYQNGVSHYNVDNIKSINPWVMDLLSESNNNKELNKVMEIYKHV